MLPDGRLIRSCFLVCWYSLFSLCVVNSKRYGAFSLLVKVVFTSSLTIHTGKQYTLKICTSKSSLLPQGPTTCVSPFISSLLCCCFCHFVFLFLLFLFLLFVTHWIRLMLSDGVLDVLAGSLLCRSCVAECSASSRRWHFPALLLLLHSFCPVSHNVPWASGALISTCYVQLSTQ